MLRAIKTTAIALIVIGAGVLALSRLALGVRGRALSLVEMGAAALVLFVAIIAVLLRKKKHIRRKYLEMRDSALW